MRVRELKKNDTISSDKSDLLIWEIIVRNIVSTKNYNRFYEICLFRNNNDIYIYYLYKLVLSTKDYEFLDKFINYVASHSEENKHNFNPMSCFTCYFDFISVGIRYNFVSITKYLLNHPNFDPYCRYNNHIWSCVNKEYKNIEIATMLIQHPKIDFSINNFRILLVAIQLDELSLVKLILQHPKVNITNFDDKCKFYDSVNPYFVKNKPISDKYKALLHYHRQLYFFHKVNRIICRAIIGNFLLKYIIMHPKSRYIARLVSEF